MKGVREMILGRSRKRRITQPLGIWEPQYRRDYSAYENQVGASRQVGVAGVKPRKSRRWGLIAVFVSFVTFLIFQTIYGIVLFQQYAETHARQVQLVATLQLGSPNSPAASRATAQLIKDLTTYAGQPLQLLLGAAGMYLVWLGFMAFATYVRGRKSFRRDFWLGFRWIDLPVGFAIALGLNLFLYLVNFLAEQAGLDLSGTDNGAALFQAQGVWQYVIAFGVGGLIGPLMEELYFRGFVMQGLIRYFRKGLRTRPITWLGGSIEGNAPGLYRAYLGFKHWLYHHKYVLAVLITAVIFGLIHTPAVQGAGNMAFVGLVTGGLGAVLGFIAVRTRRLGMNMVVHVSYNSLAILAAFLLPALS